ncbi:MAG: glycosyltransferase family 4 protein [Paramuribaculum sp.]|nr:glycosyltransferase family 4 protein [Paramuribaculum sp.]
MKIAVAGTRGFPGIQGGVETHCRELYPRIAAMGADVTVMCRRPYMSPDAGGAYRGVRLDTIYSPRRQSTETILHTFLAVVKARMAGADIIHLHACGPALMAPLARLLGMKVVTTLHGHDYNRVKWGRMARMALRLGERAAMRASNAVISISEPITESLTAHYGTRTRLLTIPNGVNPPDAPSAADREWLSSLGLTPGRYVVAVGRLVPEKGLHTLIETASALREAARLRIVVAGGADHPTAYSAALTRLAAESGVVMTGAVDHARINALLADAALFVMPSLHEGLPIALLEAMSHRLDVAVSDIESCRLPQLAPGDFFPPGDAASLAALIIDKTSHPAPRSYDLTDYDWDRIAASVLDLYRSL